MLVLWGLEHDIGAEIRVLMGYGRTCGGSCVRLS